MNWRETLRTALDAVLQHRMRSLLTMLGIVIGIASVVLTVGLDGSVNDYAEAPLEELGGISRMVNRNDAAVHATVISGRVVWEQGAFEPGFGSEFGTGGFLPAGRKVAGRVLVRTSAPA